MDATLARIIQNFSLDDFRPIIPRVLDLEEPLAPHAGNLATVVMGVRRCGKTYRLFQEMDALLAAGVQPGRMLYFNFEDNRLTERTTALGDRVLQTFFELHPDSYEHGAYFFFDEIQEVNGWDTWLRRVIDTTKATIYVTGSSSKLLSEEIASAFRGRSVVYELSPYSFSEYVHLHDPGLAEAAHDWKPVVSSGDEARAKRLFGDYLTRGGFPAVQDATERRAINVLQGYVQNAVAKDVIERHNLGNPRAVQAFARRLMATSGRSLSIRKAENELRSSGIAVSRNFLAQVLGYFEDAFLVGTVEELSRSLSTAGRAMPKVYAIDHGLALANSPAATQDEGQRLETVVYNELRRRRAGGRPGEISTLKTSEGYEVDFVMGDAVLRQDFELYQVSVSVEDERTLARELRALDAAMDEQDLATGTLLVGDGESREIAVPHGTVHQIPVWRWALES